MEQEKNNKVVIALLIVIIVILLALVVLLGTGTISFQTSSVDNSNNLNNENIIDNSDEKANENSIIDDSDEKANENSIIDDSSLNNYTNNVKYANQTESSMNLSNNKTLDIKIMDGNIIFEVDDKSVTISNVNAKYIYLRPYMDDSSTKLYYINNNNELYMVSLFSIIVSNEFDSSKLSSLKVTDSKVTDFLDFGYSYSRTANMEADTTYHNIYYLLEDGTIESLVINFYKNNN